MKKKNIFTGILFILGAVLLVISQFTDFKEIGFWSIFGGIVLLSIMIQSIVKKFWLGFFLPPVFIYWIFKAPFELPDISPWYLFGGVFLVSIGFHILFGGDNKYHHQNKCNPKFENKNDSEDNPVINVKFNGATRYLYSQNLETCQINCNFGGAEVYFAGSKLKDNKLEIFIQSKCGGVELFFPKNWKVKENVECVAGGVSFSGHCILDDNSPEININGNILAAGLEIHYI